MGSTAGHTPFITKAINMEGEMFGTERVSDLLIRYADVSSTEIAKQLISAVTVFRGELSRDDDITLMVVKAC